MVIGLGNGLSNQPSPGWWVKEEKADKNFICLFFFKKPNLNYV